MSKLSVRDPFQYNLLFIVLCSPNMNKHRVDVYDVRRNSLDVESLHKSTECRKLEKITSWEMLPKIGKCEMLHNVQVDVVRWRHGAEAGEYYRIRFAGRLWWGTWEWWN